MNKNKPIVSVIVPVYNVEKYLDQCLTSIESQTLKDIQIIVLNDGSTDSSLEIMKEHAKIDSRIQVIDKKNEGYGKTCNRGLKLACAHWVAVVEPDDWIDENMYFDMVNFACDSEIKYGEKIDIVKTPWFEVKDWDNESLTKVSAGYLCKRLKKIEKPVSIKEASIFLKKHPSIWSAIYRRKFLKKNQIKFPEFSGAGWADNPFLIDTMVSAKSIVYLDCPFYHYRVDIPGSTLNHKTDALVELPFDRWIGMTQQLRCKGVMLEEVWRAHYVRGFDYVIGAIADDGWDNQVVQKKMKELFSHMDDDFVFSHPDLLPEQKELYAEVKELDVAIPKMIGQRIRFYLNESVVRTKQDGLWNTMRLVLKKTGRVCRAAVGNKEVDQLKNSHDLLVKGAEKREQKIKKCSR